MARHPASIHFATHDEALVDWLQQQSKKEGLSQSAFLRKICQRARQDGGDDRLVVLPRETLNELTAAIRALHRFEKLSQGKA